MTLWSVCRSREWCWSWGCWDWNASTWSWPGVWCRTEWFIVGDWKWHWLQTWLGWLTLTRLSKKVMMKRLYWLG